MKKTANFRYLFLLIIALFITSCDLERIPLAKISNSTFWNTKNDTHLALMGCYTYVSSGMYEPYYDGFADNAYCQYPWETKATNVSSGSITANIDGKWQPASEKYNYEGIRRFNYFLDNVDKAPLSENKKNQYKAEVRVLRAWYYYKLINKYGPVPLITEYTENYEDVKVAPTAEEQVGKFIIDEIAQSLDYLLEQPEYKSRISKYAALAIKARIHLFFSQWQEAADASMQIINEKKFSLFRVSSLSSDDLKDDYSPFMDFTSPTDKEQFMRGLRSYEKMFWDENQGNSEVLLEVEYIKESQWVHSSGLNTLLYADNAGGGWSSITPTLDLVNAYWKSDGSKFTAPTITERATVYNNGNYSNAYLKEFKNRDTRLYASIMFPGSIWEAINPGFVFTWKKAGNNTSKTGYNFRKLTDPNTSREQWKASQNYIAIRYAEVLLSYAEAQNEVAGPSTPVFEALDEIRERIGMPKIDRAANATKEALRATIHNERRIELAAEGFRWDDIRRWGIAGDVMKKIYAIDGDLAQGRSWKNKFVRLPYPQTAVDRNPKLEESQKAKGY